MLGEAVLWLVVALELFNLCFLSLLKKAKKTEIILETNGYKLQNQGFNLNPIKQV